MFGFFAKFWNKEMCLNQLQISHLSFLISSIREADKVIANHWFCTEFDISLSVVIDRKWKKFLCNVLLIIYNLIQNKNHSKKFLSNNYCTLKILNQHYPFIFFQAFHLPLGQHFPHYETKLL